jgi:hypothetical protein
MSLTTDRNDPARCADTGPNCPIRSNKRTVNMIGSGGRGGPLDPRQTPGMPVYRPGNQ